MHRALPIAAVLVLAMPATLASAQDAGVPVTVTQGNDPNRIQFDLGALAVEDAAVEDDAVEDEAGEDDGDWGITAFQAQQAATAAAAGWPAPCTPDDDLIPSGPSGPPRYDENGALIRPATGCPSDGQGAGNARSQGGLAVLREGECEERGNSYTCTNSGRMGRGDFERETGCEETANSRTCGGSVSWGTSSEGRNAARDAIDRLRQD